MESPEPTTKVVFITPESITGKVMLQRIGALHRRQRLGIIAIDEAHCISQWGHDFRPAFKRLGILKQNFPSIPMIAATATAAPRVQRDILDLLNIGEAVFIRQSSDRTNLVYQVVLKDALRMPAIRDLKIFIDGINRKASSNDLTPGPPPCGIIYCHKRQTCEDLASTISGLRHPLTKDLLVARPYHGGLKSADRTLIQQHWTQDKIQIVVATIAFGMGIDKKDVRFVVHWNMSKGIEAYYQEAGRAGRDGKDGYCRLYFSNEDKSLHEYLMRKGTEKAVLEGKQSSVDLKSFHSLVDYCISSRCRHVSLAKYFGDTVPPCQSMCDFCLEGELVKEHLKLYKKAQLATRRGGKLVSRWRRGTGAIKPLSGAQHMQLDGADDAYGDGDDEADEDSGGDEDVRRDGVRKRSGGKGRGEYSMGRYESYGEGESSYEDRYGIREADGDRPHNFRRKGGGLSADGGSDSEDGFFRTFRQMRGGNNAQQKKRQLEKTKGRAIAVPADCNVLLPEETVRISSLSIRARMGALAKFQNALRKGYTAGVRRLSSSSSSSSSSTTGGHKGSVHAPKSTVVAKYLLAQAQRLELQLLKGSSSLGAYLSRQNDVAASIMSGAVKVAALSLLVAAKEQTQSTQNGAPEAAKDEVTNGWLTAKEVIAIQDDETREGVSVAKAASCEPTIPRPRRLLRDAEIVYESRSPSPSQAPEGEKSATEAVVAVAPLSSHSAAPEERVDDGCLPMKRAKRTTPPLSLRKASPEETRRAQLGQADGSGNANEQADASSAVSAKDDRVRQKFHHTLKHVIAKLVKSHLDPLYRSKRVSKDTYKSIVRDACHRGVLDDVFSSLVPPAGDDTPIEENESIMGYLRSHVTAWVTGQLQPTPT